MMHLRTVTPLWVMKFGGTSVGNAECIRRVAELIAEKKEQASLVVVVSAMSGVTDRLVRAAAAASNEDRDGWEGIGRELAKQHNQAVDALLRASEADAVRAAVGEQLKVFENFCSGFSLVREATPRAMDSLASQGELLSATLVAAVLRTQGIAAQAVDAADLILTDDRFGNATPAFAETSARVVSCLSPLLAQGIVPVVTGFRGATRDGACTTLGRGASDYTATIVASALDADEIWICTDVDGVMTADPRLVHDAHVIPEISYSEILELSFFGAKVLHAKAIQPAMRKKIPVRIKNTFNPSSPGTRISCLGNGQPGVRAITCVANAELITVSGKNGLSFPRLAARVFGSLGLDETPTLMVTQSSADNVLCIAVHQTDAARVKNHLNQAFELELRHEWAAIETVPDMGIIVAVGERMKGTPGIAGRMFSALGRSGINIIAIAQGSSELSISFAVKSGHVPDALKAVHTEFRL